jgi:hypothetical protein
LTLQLKRGPAPTKMVLAQLADSLDRIRRNRNAWMKLDYQRRQEFPEIGDLLRGNQNLVMKILVLEREQSGGKEPETEPFPRPSPLLARVYRGAVEGPM